MKGFCLSMSSHLEARGFMVIVGKWIRCDDGITRPVVEVKVPRENSAHWGEHSLVDTAADRTVFSADLLHNLHVLRNPAPADVSLKGIGGSSPHVIVFTVLEFTPDDGGPARVRGEFAAFTDPTAKDLSILGRDVLDNFDVITSRRRNAEVQETPQCRSAPGACQTEELLRIQASWA
jgi:hypothetical protein